jgi:hypothetical protein
MAVVCSCSYWEFLLDPNRPMATSICKFSVSMKG